MFVPCRQPAFACPKTFLLVGIVTSRPESGEMSSAAHKLAIAHGNVNRPPVRFLFVGSTTAAYFFGRHRNRLGFDTHIVTSPSLFLHFLLIFVVVVCLLMAIEGKGGYGGASPRHACFSYLPLLQPSNSKASATQSCSKVVWEAGC